MADRAGLHASLPWSMRRSMVFRAAPVLIVALAAVLPRPAAAQLEPHMPTPLLSPAGGTDDIPPGQIRFRSFGAADGLRNLFIVSVVQDGDGLLWVATDDGVYRYDGQQFTHYSRKDGLPAMAVRVLGVAPDGAVCAGTRDGMACWDGSRFSTRGAEDLGQIWIRSLARGPDTLWAGTSVGLFVRRGAGRFAPAPGWPGAASHPVRAIWADAEGVVVGDDSVLQVSAGDGVWRQLGAEVGLGRERIDAVLRDRTGTLWIRSQRYLWTLPRGATHVTDLSDGLPPGSDRTGVACGMAIAPWGDVLVGSDRGIAYRHNNAWRIIDRSVGNEAIEARALFVDREGTIWVGSVGLFQWMGRGLLTRYSTANGLPANTVWSMARDREGALWIGTGECLARAVAQRWECMAATRGWSVRAFAFTPQGGVFLGGSQPDLLYVDPAGHPTALELAGDRVADRIITGVTLGPDGDLWLSSFTGLYRLPGAVPGRPERVVVPGIPVDTRYISIVSLGDQLWAAGDSGMAVLDHGQWRVLDRASGFRASTMRHVIRRRDGRRCVSFTDVDGVTCFRWDGARVSELKDITLADGLTSGRVYWLGEDRAQRLWIGTGDGVDVITADGPDHFDETDGLAGNDMAARAFFEDRDGSLWLGSSVGLSHLMAQHYRGPPPPPRIAVLQTLIGGQVVPAGVHARVPHDRTSVAVNFASGSFTAPRRMEFQSRLWPLEHEWNATPLREARYPTLLPGSYQLEMRARIGNGAWGPPAELPLTVLPAWWQTRWFLVIAIVMGLAVTGGGVTWRLRVIWRRRTRQLHRQSDARFRDLIEAMPDLVAVQSDERLTYLNQAAREMLGLEGFDQPWLGKSLLDRIHPDDQPLATQLFREAQGAGGAQHVVELRVSAGDGTWRNCELSGRRIELANGPVVVVSGRDVTERHRLRAKLLLSDRMVSLGTLAAGIAHEINNPLAYVTANLEVVAEALDEDPGGEPTREQRAELQAAIGDAREGAERVRNIVRGLRSFSRSEEEKRQPLALPEVLAAAIRLTSNELRHRAVLVKELLPTPLVLADEGRLAQVFINLLINAAHAIPEGKTDANRITVRTRTDDQGRAVIEIQDTGQGMAPEVQARAFDPFFTTKEVGEGTGLGLSICHGIISGLGGQIAIESARGRGSLVRVILPPAREATAHPAIAAAATTPAHRRHRVMIVDDEPRVAQALKRMLHVDHDLTLVTCGAEAIEHVTAGERFDAIITDVMMPNMTGIELFDRLESLAPDQAMRMIFLSGGVFTAQTRTRLEAAGNPQLQKPVSSQELRACVAKLVMRQAS
ncbi:MAG TPA: two-component regulator propeller domain-containing protein [Kofleriaceae bacterium]|nr:two-component regulator propeller domain-containing protein [Kofleriaceae bacterium]